jgi:hypothetical protein
MSVTVVFKVENNPTESNALPWDCRTKFAWLEEKKTFFVISMGFYVVMLAFSLRASL